MGFIRPYSGRLLFSALLILVFVRTLAPWLLAKAAGLPISLLDVFRMRLRTS